MNVLFVSYSHLDSNSGIHVFNLANRLIEAGHHCAVCVPDEPEATNRVGRPLFRTIVAGQLDKRPALFPDGRSADIVHAWTPRELVRHTTERIVARSRCPYVVHMEDNEEHLTEIAMGRIAETFAVASRDELDRSIPLHLSHPTRYKDFIAGASGLTALIEPLLFFKPSSLPGRVIWPAYDDQLNWSPDPDLRFREEIGTCTTDYVVVYTGNVHQANSSEVASLYIAIAILNRVGLSTKLVRTGVNYVPLFDDLDEKEIGKFCINLGFRPRSEVPRVLSIADALVQPGRAGPFNDFRFPSKLPEYFASGKPVLIPDTNLARYVEDGVQCIVLREGNASEIATVLRNLLPDIERRRTLGRNARKFAQANFSWRKSAEILISFYREILAGSSFEGHRTAAPSH